MQWLLLLGIAVVLAALAIRRLSGTDADGESERTLTRHPYHCVTVERGWYACGAVRGLGEKRYLSREAPLLPIPGCTLQRCQCRYIHYDDRRIEERRSPFGRNSPPGSASGERRGGDRRQEPHQYRPLL